MHWGILNCLQISCSGGLQIYLIWFGWAHTYWGALTITQNIFFLCRLYQKWKSWVISRYRGNDTPGLYKFQSTAPSLDCFSSASSVNVACSGFLFLWRSEHDQTGATSLWPSLMPDWHGRPKGQSLAYRWENCSNLCSRTCLCFYSWEYISA